MLTVRQVRVLFAELTISLPTKGDAMSGWFDALAKRSARAEVPEGSAINGGKPSRRHVVAGGAAVAGAAWTAPMIMGAAAHAQAVSTCPENQICGSSRSPKRSICAPGVVGGGNGQWLCVTSTSPYTVIAPGALGGNPDSTGGCMRRSGMRVRVGNGTCGGTNAKCTSSSQCASGVCNTPHASQSAGGSATTTGATGQAGSGQTPSATSSASPTSSEKYSTTQNSGYCT